MEKLRKVTEMELDMEICKTLAVKHGLPLQFIVKEFNLMNVMNQIALFASNNPKMLVFKGGTALNKIYLQKTQRFSEDADFDLITEDARTSILRFCKRLAKDLVGYEISEFRKVHNTMQFYCSYQSTLGKDNVRVDISPKSFITAKPSEARTAISEFTNTSVNGMAVYSIEDLTARKLNAMANRSEGKDLYDVYYALPLCEPKVLKNAITKMLQSENTAIQAKDFMQKALTKLKSSNPIKLRNLTNPFIPIPRRPNNWEELKSSLALKLDLLNDQG